MEAVQPETLFFNYTNVFDCAPGVTTCLCDLKDWLGSMFSWSMDDERMEMQAMQENPDIEMLNPDKRDSYGAPGTIPMEDYTEPTNVPKRKEVDTFLKLSLIHI